MKKEYADVLGKKANELKRIVGGKYFIEVTNVPLLGMFFEKRLVF